jgi:hypothetical protein
MFIVETEVRANMSETHPVLSPFKGKEVNTQTQLKSSLYELKGVKSTFIL